MPGFNFFTEDVKFFLPDSRVVSKWIRLVILQEARIHVNLNFVFCSDEYLRQINNKFLRHDTYTDIVTFDNSEHLGEVEGDIFISIDRVSENALKFKRPFFEELSRVIIHGVLHLIGYDDKTPSQKRQMRKKEDTYLSLLSVPRGTSKKTAASVSRGT